MNQLAEWGLAQDVIDDTALVVSEPGTNSVRYAKGPIQLRLIRDSTLVCEVADHSSASPHPRRALETDENGRGLFITTSAHPALGRETLRTRKDAVGRTKHSSPRHTTLSFHIAVPRACL
ncbi:ATP-binding protein [Streptomyces sp. NPDC008122]|uniref:ATP-binding protein n=1 Tax=Streptomyces sp. NPDC008122 TaxID=3364810 RepID=UPI0036E315AC